MDWSEAASEFPAPRDDEPAHLRQDIHDELADHLRSALERELRHDLDETAARGHVLAKFGDPRKVARKLWQDAMWEKLMSQRLQLVATALMLAACAGMFWMTATIASQGREMNAALMARLEQLSHQPASANPEWNPASVQLVSESAGPLPAGFRVGFLSKDFQLEQAPDAEGRVNLGLQRPGSCTLSVATPWGESMSDQQTPIRAGEPFAVRIVCPSAPERFESPLELRWPEGLDSPDIWLACWAKPKARTIAGREWSTSGQECFFIDHSGRILMVTDGLVKSRFDILSDSAFSERYLGNAYGYERPECQLAGPLKTVPNLALSEFFENQVTVAPVRIRDVESNEPTCTQVAALQSVPLEFDRKAAHWTLSVPAVVKQQIDQLAAQESEIRPASYPAPRAAVEEQLRGLRTAPAPLAAPPAPPAVAP